MLVSIAYPVLIKIMLLLSICIEDKTNLISVVCLLVCMKSLLFNVLIVRFLQFQDA